MKVNCHAHIFNAASVFTEATLEILLRRLRMPDLDFPTSIGKKLAEIVRSYFEETNTSIEPETLIVNSLRDFISLEDLTEGLPESMRVELNFLRREILDTIGADFLSDILMAVWDSLSDKHDIEQGYSLLDMIEFLTIALQPDISSVTDILIEQLGQSFGIVALTMDIIETPTEDDSFYLNQLRETSRQIIRYPGRIFPFVCVHPLRKNFLEVMHQALETMGYVGVKLYPSLGYRLKDPLLQPVYKYCEENSIPIMTHCSQGGFYAKKTFRRYSAPSEWNAILKQYPKLKVCLGHFGEGNDLTADPIVEGGQVKEILALMDNYDNVFADISHHTVAMPGGNARKTYRKNLLALLRHETYRHRILFGSDFFLVRRHVKDKNFLAFYMKLLGKDHFRQISEDNTARFLNFPSIEAPFSYNMERYITFVARHSGDAETLPPPWLAEAIRLKYGANVVVFRATALGLAWSRNNLAHYALYEEFNNTEFLESTAFEEAGSIKLSAMAYWRDLRVPSSLMIRVMLRERAVRLYKIFLDKGATPVEEDCIQKLVSILRNGSISIAELGSACDRLFKF